MTDTTDRLGELKSSGAISEAEYQLLRERRERAGVPDEVWRSVVRFGIESLEPTALRRACELVEEGWTADDAVSTCFLGRRCINLSAPTENLSAPIEPPRMAPPAAETRPVTTPPAGDPPPARVDTNASSHQRVATRQSPQPSGRSSLGVRLASTILWLGLCAGVFAMGASLSARGRVATTNEFGGVTADYSSGGLIGNALMCFAVAMFFAKGSVSSMSRTMRGKGSAWDALWAGSNVKFLIISALALAAGCSMLYLAATK